MRYQGLHDNEKKQLHHMFDGCTILVTGGTGSFGKKFIARLFTLCQPRRVIVFSRDELKQYEMQQEFIQYQPSMRYFIGDVRDQERLDTALRGVDYIVHAAALKHVPIGEYNPFEMVKTNIHGAEHIISSAIRNKVKKTIALSTDKACNPVNLYGATKLASDKIFVAANNLSGSKDITFSVVRYGNVVGSRGSVIPYFAKLIRDKNSYIPITDERMTRFVITLEHGVDFVLSSFLNMQGGEIYIPKIPSIKITDLAHIMAPYIPTEITGIRPGEKLHEIMIAQEDALHTIDSHDRYVIEPMINALQYKSKLIIGKNNLPDNFGYDSFNNQDWLNKNDLKMLVQDYLK